MKGRFANKLISILLDAIGVDTVKTKRFLDKVEVDEETGAVTLPPINLPLNLSLVAQAQAADEQGDSE